MQGKRVYPNEEGVLILAPGEYGIDPRNGQWYCRVPDPDVGMGNLASHEVTEHDDGTVTVSPSILVAGWKGQHWHGYLEKGIWREV